MKDILRSGTFWFSVAVLLVLGVGAGLSAVFWGDLSGPEGNKESLSTTVRNVMLMLGGLLALPLAIWRGWVAEQQVKVTRESVDATLASVRATDANTAEQRFQAAAQMLGHELHAFRLEAIHALADLADDNPVRFHVNAARLLSAFIQNPLAGDGVIVRMVDVEPGWEEREDVLAAIKAIGARTDAAIRVEEIQQFRINLEESDLSHMVLRGMNLSRVLLRSANFYGTDLQSVNFTDADLSRCSFSSAYVQDAIFDNAKLSGANFTRWALDEDGQYTDHPVDPDAKAAFGLRQEQLDAAQNDQNDPPKLRDTTGLGTSFQRLSWHGRLQDQL